MEMMKKENGMSNAESNITVVREIFESCRINPEEIVERPPVAIMINSEGGPTPSFTLGNFSMIIGKAKSKKTFLVGVLAAAAIKGEPVLDVVEGRLPYNQRKVLYFDTEQGKYHANRSIKRIAQLSGIEHPENLYAYSLRKFRPEMRVILIRQAISMFSELGLVIIDGGRDLLSLGINDEKSATDVTSEFLRWTEEKQIHLVVVLHQNKNDLNARGHFGTECVNKAETTVSVTQYGGDQTISVVECEYSRDIQFRRFAFRINDEGLPELVIQSELSSHRTKITKIEHISVEFHRDIIRSTLSNNAEFHYEALWRAIKASFEDNGYTLSDSNSKRFVKYYREQGWIIFNRRRMNVIGDP